jgi:cysteine synthase A
MDSTSKAATMIIDSLLKNGLPGPSFPVTGLVRANVYLKCEALNITGSIKLKPAASMIDRIEATRGLKAGDKIIESSSGNLGIAASFLAAERGYQFICVVDPNAAPESVRTMRALGARVIVVDKKDANGGFLGTRLELIKRMCMQDPSLVWLNQYDNEANWQSHFETTAMEILEDFPTVHRLYIGSGTGGTLMGCARYFRIHSPNTQIVAVDVEGSVAFHSKPGPRYIPGIGTSRRPEILDESFINDIVYIKEIEAIRMCRQMARRGLFAGGSTGSVLAAIVRHTAMLEPSDIVVGVMPDFGYKYLDSVYSDGWVNERFGVSPAEAEEIELADKTLA